MSAASLEARPVEFSENTASIAGTCPKMDNRRYSTQTCTGTRFHSKIRVELHTQICESHIILKCRSSDLSASVAQNHNRGKSPDFPTDVSDVGQKKCVSKCLRNNHSSVDVLRTNMLPIATKISRKKQIKLQLIASIAKINGPAMNLLNPSANASPANKAAIMIHFNNSYVMLSVICRLDRAQID